MLLWTPEDAMDLLEFAKKHTVGIRLESFLFTIESFGQARKLLKDDGVLVLYILTAIWTMRLKTATGL